MIVSWGKLYILLDFCKEHCTIYYSCFVLFSIVVYLISITFYIYYLYNIITIQLQWIKKKINVTPPSPTFRAEAGTLVRVTADITAAS